MPPFARAADRTIAAYGTTSGAAYADADVDLGDLAALLAVYGTTCE
ncbi:MAG: hypothetical protein ACE5I3_08645 [Phycisphaerae bacterium]